MAELSAASNTTVPTIKYYLREGLLHPGVRTSATQSQYDESHVGRLRLVRAMLDVGGLSVARTAEVLSCMEDPSRSLLSMLGTTQASVTVSAADEEALGGRPGSHEVDELIRRRGWRVSARAAAREIAGDVFASYSALGNTDIAVVIDQWADAAEIAAEADMQAVLARGNRSDMVETVVVGTVLGDVLIGALRRLAQEHLANKYFPETGSPL